MNLNNLSTMNPDKLATFINDHPPAKFHWTLPGNLIQVSTESVNTETFAVSREYEVIQATAQAVREWLGY